MKKYKNLILFLIICFLAITTILISLSWGTYSLDFASVINTLFGKGSNTENIIIFDLRLPRIAVAIVVGIALSTAGCILQSITRNDLSEPGIIGINAGAALAVVLFISYNTGSYYNELGDLSIFLMPAIAIIGALITSVIIYALSYNKGITPVRILLIGIGINAGINSVIALYQLILSAGDFNRVLTWTSGSLWGSNLKFFLASAPIIVILYILTLFKHKTLDILNLGDETAIGLGINVEKERKYLLLLVVGLAAAATAVAGNISFLGLLAPHIAKKLFGFSHKKILLISAIISVIIIVGADAISRNLFSPIEIPVGITISILGVPYFIYLMLKEKE